MKEQFFALIFPENFFDLLFASYLSLLGKKVALSLPEDNSDLTRSILIDPYLSQLVCTRLGIGERARENPYEPDFQILSPDFRVDIFAQRDKRRFALERDLKELGEEFFSFLDRLLAQTEPWEEELKTNFPLPRSRFRFIQELLQSLSARSFSFQTLQGFRQENGFSPQIDELALAPLVCFSPYFHQNAPALSVGLLWKFLLSSSEQGSEEKETRLEEIISASGKIIPQEIIALKTEKKSFISARPSSGEELSARYYFFSPNRAFALLDEEERERKPARALASIFARTTFCQHRYEISPELVPEALAPRAVWVQKSEPRAVILVLKKQKRKAELVVGYFLRKSEPRALSDEEIAQILQGIFLWLSQEQLEKKAKPGFSHQFLKFSPLQLKSPRLGTSYVNLFLPASELVPFLGLSGIFRWAEVLAQEE